MTRRISAAALVALLSPALAHAEWAMKPSLRIALLHVGFTDTTPLYSESQLEEAAAELTTYFDTLSYHNLDLDLHVSTVSLARPSGDAIDECKGALPSRGCLRRLHAEALAAAEEREWFDHTVYDGIALIYPFDGADFAGASVALDLPGWPDRVVTGTFFSRALPGGVAAPGPSGVNWSGWAHEIGHMLQVWNGSNTNGKWEGHPSRYASAYSLMDSCYPCGETAYSLIGPAFMKGTRRVFNGWLPDSKVRVIPAPATGVTEERIFVRALSRTPYVSFHPQVLVLPVDPGVSVLVEVRQRAGADAYGAGPGIWDEGVRITRMNETGDPPVSNIETCDTLVPGGCVRSWDDPRFFPNCVTTAAGTQPKRRGDIPDFCWPYPLWHDRNDYTDPAAGLTIRVEEATATGQWVRIIRRPVPPAAHLTIGGTPAGELDAGLGGVMAPRPSVPGAAPGPASPDMPFAETPATGRPVLGLPTPEPGRGVWLDSSCNGYATDVGPSGLRYDRNVGGDRLCAGHENRLYTEVGNIGTATARGMQVRFSVARPALVRFDQCPETTDCPTTDWYEVGVVALPDLPPGGQTQVHLPWNPEADALESGPAGLSLAVRAQVERIDGGPSNGRLEAEVNIDRVEAVVDPLTGESAIAEETLWLINGDATTRTYPLETMASLPPGWEARVKEQAVVEGESAQPLSLAIAPVQGDAAPLWAGMTYTVETRIHTRIVADGPTGAFDEQVQIAAPSLEVHAVLPSSVELRVEVTDNGGQVTGWLAPGIAGAVVALDIVDAQGATTTRLLRTGLQGEFTDTLPSGSGRGGVQDRALFQGDALYAASMSSTVSL